MSNITVAAVIILENRIGFIPECHKNKSRGSLSPGRRADFYDFVSCDGNLFLDISGCAHDIPSFYMNGKIPTYFTLGDSFSSGITITDDAVLYRTVGHTQSTGIISMTEEKLATWTDRAFYYCHPKSDIGMAMLIGAIQGGATTFEELDVIAKKHRLGDGHGFVHMSLNELYTICKGSKQATEIDDIYTLYRLSVSLIRAEEELAEARRSREADKKAKATKKSKSARKSKVKKTT